MANLTMEERKQIAEMHAALQSQKRIAEALGRHRTTIGRRGVIAEMNVVSCAIKSECSAVADFLSRRDR